MQAGNRKYRYRSTICQNSWSFCLHHYHPTIVLIQSYICFVTANASSATIRTKVDTLDEDVNFNDRCHSNDASPQWHPEFTEDEETTTTAQHFTETQQTKITLLDKLCQCRVHIILLALIVRLTLLMDMGYIFGNVSIVNKYIWSISELD
jgi:hypothetical protein